MEKKMGSLKYLIGREETGFTNFDDPEDIMEEITFRIKNPYSEDLLNYNCIYNQLKLNSEERSIEVFAERTERINYILHKLPIFSLCKFQTDNPNAENVLDETNFIILTYDVKENVDQLKSELVKETGAFFCSANIIRSGIIAVYWIRESIKNHFDYMKYFDLFAQHMFNKNRSLPANFNTPISCHPVPFDKNIIINPDAARLKTSRIINRN